MDAKVQITITAPDGTVLDEFPVTHWLLCQSEDDEGVGSKASESLLVTRIARAIRNTAEHWLLCQSEDDDVCTMQPGYRGVGGK
jgi:hypothetical protein